jgi:hypothetical protein
MYSYEFRFEIRGCLIFFNKKMTVAMWVRTKICKFIIFNLQSVY